MNPFLTRELANEHIGDLRRAAAKGKLTLRSFQERDIDGIRRLAQLDSKPAPEGPVLVAEVGGELVAALPLNGGPVLADPFTPTTSIVELLRMRATQLKPRRRLRHRHAFPPVWRPRAA
jgi:hypothetical protein